MGLVEKARSLKTEGEQGAHGPCSHVQGLQTATEARLRKEASACQGRSASWATRVPEVPMAPGDQGEVWLTWKATGPLRWRPQWGGGWASGTLPASPPCFPPGRRLGPADPIYPVQESRQTPRRGRTLTEPPSPARDGAQPQEGSGLSSWSGSKDLSPALASPSACGHLLPDAALSPEMRGALGAIHPIPCREVRAWSPVMEKQARDPTPPEK